MRNRTIVAVLTAMAAGRAMTLPYIGRAGGAGPGDPPDAWLMPLVADALIGLTAAVLAVLVWKRPTPLVWVLTVVWSAIAGFDALAALLVEITVPWPEFFMLQTFGRSMFLLAAALHAVILYLLARPDTRSQFGIDPQAAALPAAGLR